MRPASTATLILLTAEHGGNEVPAEHRRIFRGHEALLRSHRGWDPGTLSLARSLAGRLGAPLLEATVTRLLVDLNRSAHNPRVFSEITRSLPPRERAGLLERFHRPHRESAASLVEREVAGGRQVLHLGIHSFTPRLNGSERTQDLAILYDPAREGERALVARWIAALRSAAPTLRIRRNHPYRGRDDGLTTTLRRRFPQGDYLGIEVEVSQRHVRADGTFPEWVGSLLLETLDRI